MAFSVNGTATLDSNESWVNIAQASATLEQGPVQFNDINVGLTTTGWELLVNDLDLASSAQLLLEAGLIPDSVREPLAAHRSQGPSMPSVLVVRSLMNPFSGWRWILMIFS